VSATRRLGRALVRRTPEARAAMRIIDRKT